jgi:hypothetical protein
LNPENARAGPRFCVILTEASSASARPSSRRPEQREARKNLGQLRASEAGTGLLTARFTRTSVTPDDVQPPSVIIREAKDLKRQRPSVLFSAGGI